MAFRPDVLNQLPIDANIAQFQALDIPYNAGLLYILKAAVFKAQVENRSMLESLNIQGMFAFAAFQISDRKVAHHRCEFALLSFFIVEVDGDCGVCDLAHLDISEV